PTSRPPEPAGRPRRRTQPPPPPGSHERKALEQAILETGDTIDSPANAGRAAPPKAVRSAIDEEAEKPRGEVILAATRGAKKSATKPPPIPAAAVAKATSS